jgi:hypothetical protein
MTDLSKDFRNFDKTSRVWTRGTRMNETLNVLTK